MVHRSRGDRREAELCDLLETRLGPAVDEVPRIRPDAPVRQAALVDERRNSVGVIPIARLNTQRKFFGVVYPTCLAIDVIGASVSRSSWRAFAIRIAVRYLRNVVFSSRWKRWLM